MDRTIRHTICPIIAAVIWGTAFSAQSVASAYVQPFSLNAFRSLVAALVLGAFCLLNRRRIADKGKLLKAGLFCGLFLFLASNCQQLGISETSAGKSGFVTALYIVLVPLFSLFLKQKPGRRVWISVAVAVAGLYFLCVSGEFTVGLGDLSLLACAAFFAVQILGIDHLAGELDEIAFTALEFAVCGVLSAAGALAFEPQKLSNYGSCMGSLLYIAIFSSCVAYTLQTVSQKGGNPSVISLLMSLESVFAVLGGAVLLHERLTGREYLGCALMAVAVVLAQLPDRKAGRTPASGEGPAGGGKEETA